MSEEYAYAVARVHAKEFTLLNAQDLEQLLSCGTEQECMSHLSDKGFGAGLAPKSAGELLEYEQNRTWEFLRELMGQDASLDLFRLPADYHNLKAAVKCAVTGRSTEGVFRQGGTLPWEQVWQAVREKEFSSLPQPMAEAGEEAYLTLLRTGDGQLCDLILDRQCLSQIQTAGRRSGDPALEEYAVKQAAFADIRAAVRCARASKGEGFLKKALVPCPGLDLDRLSKAAAESVDALSEYLRLTEFSGAAELVKGPAAQLEKWCDDRLLDVIRTQKYAAFGLGPLAGYLLARENELKAVRMILSAKRNRLDEGLIRERLREMYV